MGNKSSTPEPITISGFGGYGNSTDTFVSNIKHEFPNSDMPPFTITGIRNVKIIPESSLNTTVKTVVEVGTLKTTEDQTIIIGTTTYTFKKGTYYINKTEGNDYYTLMNVSKNFLKNLIVSVSMGGRRKRQTKGRKAKKHSRRRRSIRA
jgi:hypothetical protein